ncbi:hypothetical protein [Actinoplanes derwentensis]|uniref:hypothetical protein n=1 Tax=Actinoplanes derwentensis TaxID=113562 RepID=UPI0012FDB90A|nr:hypothetical protein [Actinoplanes derwentensis]
MEHQHTGDREQVAAQLNLRVSTVRGRLARARSILTRHVATDTDAEGQVSRHV